MRIDHVLLASRDMEATAARLLADHGLASVEGGRHPGWGTGNRIIPVGDQYLEIIGVVDEAAATQTPLGQHILALTAHGDRLMGWCVRPDSLDETAARLGLEVVPGSRTRPDGVEVRWRLAGLTEAMADPRLPFFIEWENMAAHPSTMPVDSRVKASEIAWLEVGGELSRLKRWLGGGSLPVRNRRDPRVTAVAIASDAGEIVIRG